MKLAHRIAREKNPRELVQKCENKAKSFEYNHCLGIKRYQFVDKSTLAYRNNGVDKKEWFAIDNESRDSIEAYKVWVGQLDSQELALIATMHQLLSNPTTADIYQNFAEYVENSGFEVDVNSSLPTVSISNGFEGYFLDGHNAEAYIAACKAIEKEAPELDMDTIQTGHAKQYIDCL